MINAAAKRRRSRSPRQRSLEARIYEVYADLPPSERRLADVLLLHQRDLPSYTAGELATKANVSKATAARLIRSLGYSTYPEAKRQIRMDQHWGSAMAELPGLAKVPADEITLAKTVEFDLENIRATAESIPAETLALLVDALVAAPRIWIIGLRSGYGLAYHAHHYFTLIKPHVRVLPAGGATYAHEIASIGPGDVLLAIAFRRRPRLLPTILTEAGAAGAVTALITDVSAAASARASQLVLRCRCQSPSPFNSFVAAVTLINHLAWATAAKLGEESVQRFTRIDRLVGLLDDVSTPMSDPKR